MNITQLNVENVSGGPFIIADLNVAYANNGDTIDLLIGNDWADILASVDLQNGLSFAQDPTTGNPNFDLRATDQDGNIITAATFPGLVGQIRQNTEDIANNQIAISALEDAVDGSKFYGSGNNDEFEDQNNWKNALTGTWVSVANGGDELSDPNDPNSPLIPLNQKYIVVISFPWTADISRYDFEAMFEITDSNGANPVLLGLRS